MKVLCSYSGLEFEVQHFPFSLSSGETCHPVFHIPQKETPFSPRQVGSRGIYSRRLLSLHPRSSEFLLLIHWYTPAKRTPFTTALIAQCIDPLSRAVIKLNTVTEPERVFPSFAITKETCTLQNLPEWIRDWEAAYKDLKDGYRSAHDSRKLIAREAALARLIKSPHAPIPKIAAQIAEWAAEAGNFPRFLISNPFSPRGPQIPLREYWIQLIIRSCKKEQIFSLSGKDLQELLDHCEEHIPLGSIYSQHLFSTLRQTIARNKDFLGLDSLGSYTLLEDSAKQDVESANILALVNAAPSSHPKREDYPSDFKFLQAKLRWDLARKAGFGKTEEEGASE